VYGAGVVLTAWSVVLLLVVGMGSTSGTMVVVTSFRLYVLGWAEVVVLIDVILSCGQFFPLQPSWVEDAVGGELVGGEALDGHGHVLSFLGWSGGMGVVPDGRWKCVGGGWACLPA
jgi:hypothetical protein